MDGMNGNNSAINEKLKDRILDSIAEGVFVVDKNFRISFFNKAAERITGFKENEVLGHFCKHIFQSTLCYKECPIAKALKNNENIYDYEAKILTNKKGNLPIKLNTSVLFNEKEEPVGGIVTFRDISELEAIRHSLTKQSDFHGVIGHSKHMREIFELIEEIADCEAPVFVHGESGVGKEMIVNAIQSTSVRRDKPFIKLNCSVLPDQLLASELFGHVKGAFTDAVKDRVGRFEMADGGTIFLDEVAEMPAHMQLQLLRVLQEGTFERVGESITRTVDVRIIAATNIDIDEALKTGKFREDLFYRLSVIPIHILPLRERKDDILPLAKHFLKKFSLLYKKDVIEISDQAMDTLLAYDWPGNIRELENVLEYAFVRTPAGALVDCGKLPENIRSSCQNGSIPKETITFGESGDEGAKLLYVLEKHKWNKSKVAEELNIGRTTLWRRMKKYNLV